MRAKLVIDTLGVRLDRVDRDIELLGDLWTRQFGVQQRSTSISRSVSTSSGKDVEREGSGAFQVKTRRPPLRDPNALSKLIM